MGNKICYSFVMFICSLILFPSCSWMQGHVEDKEISELDSTMAGQKRTTLMDDSLIEFGKMLQAYDLPPGPIQSQNIGNETAEKGMPTSIYTMVATSLNKIGRQIVFIPYDTQYVINESTTGGKIQRTYPDAVISGGITGFDKDLIEKEREGDVSAGWAGASGSARYNAAEVASKITLDMNVRDYKTQAYFPGVLASNSIIIRNDRLGWGVSAAYMNFSVSFDSEVKTKEGIYSALRFLVELSVLEVMGKYFSVPYWKCVKGASEDSNMVIRLKDNFQALSSSMQILYLKKYIYLSGYTGVDRTSDSLSPSEQSVVSSLMRQYSVNDYPSLLVEVWKNVPIEKALYIVQKDRKAKARLDRLNAEKSKVEAANRARELAEQQQLASQQAKTAQENYNISINKAKDYLAKSELKKAQSEYSKALKNIPDDKYALAQLKSVTDQLQYIESTNKAYSEVVALGDSYLKNREYDKAFSEYQKASQLKQNEEYPKQKIEEVSKILDRKNPLGIKNISDKDWNEDNI